MTFKNILKSIGALLAGFLTVMVLSILTDMIVEGLGILPPLTQPEAYVTWMYIVALGYRSLYTVLGGFITARLAPSKPMLHAIILGVIGTAAGTAGAIINWNLGDHWYPISLAASALPLILLGALFAKKKR